MTVVAVLRARMLETCKDLGLCRDHEFYLSYDTFINGQANGVSKCPVSDISLLSNLFLALRDVRQTGQMFSERI